MQLYSTNSPDVRVDFRDAVFRSLPPDNGLYMPLRLPLLDPAFFARSASLPDMAYHLASALLEDALDKESLRSIVEEAVNFPAPLVALDRDTYVLELFHGPSMAFKDFGARFMSRVMGRLLDRSAGELHILVATSGDTGGAVAMGFHEVPGIRVTILYPSGKVSALQELQLTTLGGNVRALEIGGSFDDCQRLVKQAFLDPVLNKRLRLSSANSINIARLIPQMFYYVHAWTQLRDLGEQRLPVFAVPSGNFGNLTAGLMARRMGLPVRRFVAATNVNDEVPQYLRTGRFEPRPTRHTLSNAMDVGNPSNFARMLDLFGGDAAAMAQVVSGYSFTDEETLAAIEEVFAAKGYVMCPHTAVAYLGWRRCQAEVGGAGVFLSTAHPCKFPGAFPAHILPAISLPPQARALEGKTKQALPMGTAYAPFRDWLLAES